MNTFVDFTQTQPPEEFVAAGNRALSSAGHIHDWVRSCDKCRDIPTVRDAMSDDQRVNGYTLNTENPISADNPKCLGKFVGEGPHGTVMFIGMNPGCKREKGDRTLRGKWPTTGAWLRLLFNHFGYDWDDFYLTNLAKCSTHDNGLPVEVIRNCFPILVQEIESVGPTKLVLLGGNVIDAFKVATGAELYVRLEPFNVALPGSADTSVPTYCMPHPGAQSHQVSKETKLRHMAHVLGRTGA